MRLTITAALLMPGVAWGQVGPAPFSLSGQNVNTARSASATGMSRSLSDRLGDVFNPMDYGALGTGAATPIGTAYGASLAALAAYGNATGNHPFAFAADPKFGLTFSMTPSATSATASQAFLFNHVGINNVTATVAIWQDPAYGNYLVTPGMQVTGACITRPTTVASVGRNPGLAGAPDPTYGTVTLSAAPATPCSGSTPLTFTTSPAQVALLTADWLGWQAAMAQAFYAPNGGNVRAPQGVYVLNHSLLNPGGITDSNAAFPNIDVAGAGVAETTLYFPADLGLDMGAVTEANSAGESVTSASAYHDFRIRGPANNHVQGTGNTLNGAAVGMDGMRVGRGAVLHNLLINGVNGGISGVNDHTALNDVYSSNNACGYRYRDYTYTMGNQVIENGSMSGNYVASFCMPTTNQMDSSLVKNVHTGFGPRGFWYLPNTANVTSTLGFLSNTTLIDVWVEGVGNCWICGAGHTGAVDGNIFIGGGGDGVVANPTFQISNGSGGYLAPTGIVDVGDFSYNTMIGTNWNSYRYLSDAAVVSSGNCLLNHWQGDGGFIFYALPTVNQLDCASVSGNTFGGPAGSGVIRTALYGDTTQYEALSEYGYSGVGAFTPGLSFAGLAATAVTHGQHRTVAVLKSAPSIPPANTSGAQGAPKTNPAQGIGNGQPVFADAGGGVSGGLSQTHAIGVAIVDGPSGSSVVQIALDPGMAGGAPGAATGLAAAGTSQATATAITAEVSEFTTVPSGAGAVLGIIPVGTTETICNDGANAENVYPQVGGTIQGLAMNAAASVPAASCLSFRRLSTTLWHR